MQQRLHGAREPKIFTVWPFTEKAGLVLEPCPKSLTEETTCRLEFACKPAKGVGRGTEETRLVVSGQVWDHVMGVVTVLFSVNV